MSSCEQDEKTIKELTAIQKTIQTMSKHNQVEILKILKNNDVILNTNKYGTFINLSEVKEDVIVKLKEYIDYYNIREMDFIQVENQKEIYKNTIFNKK